MGKLDDLKKAAGGNITESASRREAASMPAAAVANLNPTRMEGVARSKAALEIPLSKIERDPDQPREEFEPEALERLAESIRTRGLLQPVRVRWDEGRGVYVLIAGERRWRAAAMAGLKTLTCIVADAPMTASELLAVQVTENLLREDLRPVERARAFRTLMEINGWSGNRLAKELHISQPAVVQALALLDLPAEIQDHVEEGTLAPTVGYELSRVEDRAEQAALAEQAIEHRLSRSEVQEAVRKAESRPSTKGRGGSSKAKPGKPKKPTTETFRTSAGPRVTIEHRKGLDTDLLIAALEDALTSVRGRLHEAAA